VINAGGLINLKKEHVKMKKFKTGNNRAAI